MNTEQMNTEAAKVYYVDGSVKEVSPKNGDVFTLEEIQELVQGRVELYNLPGGRIALFDEDGKFKNKPVNHEASIFLRSRTVGTVVICAKRMF